MAWHRFCSCALLFATWNIFVFCLVTKSSIIQHGDVQMTDIIGHMPRPEIEPAPHVISWAEKSGTFCTDVLQKNVFLKLNLVLYLKVNFQ